MMSLILHTGFDDAIELIKAKFAGDNFEAVEDINAAVSRLQHADLLLVGPLTGDPVKVLQTVNKHDKLLSTVILPSDEEYTRVKERLLFAPFVGKTADCIRNDQHAFEEMTKALRQTRQRRQFAHVKSAVKQPELPKPKVEQLQYIGGFLEQAPISAILLNRSHEVIDMNRFARRMFNITPVQEVSSLEDLFDNSAVRSVMELIENRSDSRTEEIFSGQEYYEITVAEVMSSDSEKLDLLLINDITERKLEEQRIRAVLDALPQMAFTTNVQGETTYLTAGWYTFTGRTHEESIGLGWLTAVHPEDQEGLARNWERSVNNNKTFEHEARYLRKDGEYRWHLVRAIPIYTGSRIGYWLGTCTDIDDHKVVEKELEELVRQRTQELQKSNNLLQKSNHELEEFAFVASHDLKEPLRKIQTFIQLGLSASDENVKTTYLNKVSDAALRMSNLIDGILEYSKVSKKQLYEQVDLNEVLQHVKGDLDVHLREKNGRIEAEPLPVLSGVRVQMHQLFHNIINNSLKYTDAHPLITIRHQRIRAGSKSLPKLLNPSQDYHRISFSDNGIGFEQKYADQIFTIFRRLHSRDKYGGSGIGLALCAKIAANHHGYIEAESEVGKGATFNVYLPADKALTLA